MYVPTADIAVLVHCSTQSVFGSGRIPFVVLSIWQWCVSCPAHIPCHILGDVPHPKEVWNTGMADQLPVSDPAVSSLFQLHSIVFLHMLPCGLTSAMSDDRIMWQHMHTINQKQYVVGISNAMLDFITQAAAD